VVSLIVTVRKSRGERKGFFLSLFRFLFQYQRQSEITVLLFGLTYTHIVSRQIFPCCSSLVTSILREEEYLLLPVLLRTTNITHHLSADTFYLFSRARGLCHTGMAHGMVSFLWSHRFKKEVARDHHDFSSVRGKEW